MNIQIFGKNKCFDTKKAQRYFKERGIKFQFIDLTVKGMSRGELDSVLKAVGGVEQVFDSSSKDKDALLVKYLSEESAKIEKLLENPKLIKTPVVRNVRLATIGYMPEVWKTWE